MIYPYRLFRALIVVSVICLSLGHSLLWAPPLPAPAKVLQHPRTQVVLGTYRGRLDDGRYHFSAINNVRGPDTPPTELMVRGPDWLVGWLSPAQEYFFAYSTYVRNPRFRKETLVDTDGPRLIDSPGLEPALFLHRADLRQRLLHRFDQEQLHSAAFIADVIAGLGSTDTQLQNFYATEISVLAELGQSHDQALVQAIKTLLDNADGHASARAVLLRLVAANPEIYDRDYLKAAVQRVLLAAPLTGYQDLQPRSGELVAAALQLAKMHTLALQPEALRRLVGCDSAALAEAALLAIRQIDAAQERPVIVQTLQQTQLPATTREFLLDHLRRLDLSAGHTKKVNHNPDKGTANEG